MPSKWIVRRDEVESQPLEFHRLTKLADSGRLRRTDLVRQEHETEWRKAGNIRGLFISTRSARLSTLAAAAFVSILLTGLLRVLFPSMWGGESGGLVWAFWKGGVFLGSDPTGYGGLMILMVKCIRTHYWLPGFFATHAQKGWTVLAFMPLWILSTVILSLPAFFRPRCYSVGSLLARLGEFVRLSPTR